MLGSIRPKTKALTKILAKPFVWLKVPPNFVSFLGIPLALIATFFIYQSAWLEAFAFVVLAILMDFIDGSVAEQLGKTTFFGNFFETMMDKYTEAIILGAFVFHFPLEAIVALGLSLIESYAKPRAALVVIADNRDWPALGEHADKIIIIMIGLLGAAFYPAIGGIDTVQLALWILIAMVLIGGIQRILYAKKLISEGEKKGKILPYLLKNAGHKAVE